MGQLDGFSAEAQAVIRLAQADAANAGIEHVGTEHVLLALLEAENGLGSLVLKDLGVTHAAVRYAVAHMAERSQRIILTNLMATSRLEDVLKFAREEASASAVGSVGSEHLLLGLVGDRDCVAAQVLADLRDRHRACPRDQFCPPRRGVYG